MARQLARPFSLLLGGLRRASSLALSSARPLAANSSPATLSCSWPPPASVSGLQRWSVLAPEPSPRAAVPPQPLGLLGLALELSDEQPVSGGMLAKAGPPRRTKEQWLHIKKTKKFVKSLAKLSTKRNASGRKYKFGR